MFRWCVAFSDVPLNKNPLQRCLCFESFFVVLEILTVKSDYVNEVDHIFGAGIIVNTVTWCWKAFWQLSCENCNTITSLEILNKKIQLEVEQWTLNTFVLLLDFLILKTDSLLFCALLKIDLGSGVWPKGPFLPHLCRVFTKLARNYHVTSLYLL